MCINAASPVQYPKSSHVCSDILEYKIHRAIFISSASHIERMKTNLWLSFLFGCVVATGEARLTYHDGDHASTSAESVEQVTDEASGMSEFDSDMGRTLQSSCTLCPSGERPHNLWSTLVVGDSRVTCRVAHQLGDLSNKVSASECASIRQIGETLCLCNTGQPPFLNSCKLCEDGSNLSNPTKKIIGAVTCREVRDQMRRDFERNCWVWQGAIGPYCGCNNPITSAKVCHLCNTDKLPFPTRVVNGRTCLRHEFEASLARQCIATKKAVGAQCCN